MDFIGYVCCNQLNPKGIRDSNQVLKRRFWNLDCTWSEIKVQLLVDKHCENRITCCSRNETVYTKTISFLPSTRNNLVSLIRSVCPRRGNRGTEVILMGRDFSRLQLVRGLRFAVLAIVCILLVQSKSALGQVDEGSITGTVQDASGAVVPNADVTLQNTDQGITLQTKSNASGIYTFSPVRIGHYTITATAQGFAKTTQKNVTVSVAQVLQVNISLKLGGTTETVEVNTAPPVLQTQEASVGQVIGETQVNDLPLNGRNFTFLAQLGAGMQTPQADTRGNAASGAFSANGLRPAQNNYLLDGIDNNSNAVDFL